MKQKRLEQIFIEHDAFVSGMAFGGKCHDCCKEISVKVDAEESGFYINGGAIYEPEPDNIFLKCDDCFKQKPWLTKWKACEVYSRVVGYYRPIKQWNDAKKREYGDRINFDLGKAVGD